MDWLQVIVIVFGNVAWILPLWLWSRAESRADNRQMLSLMQGIQNQIVEGKKEMTDFHGRLCVLEERYIQMMQRIFENRK